MLTHSAFFSPLLAPLPLPLLPDGLEFIKRYRSFEHKRDQEAIAKDLPRRKRLTIIACSANDNEDLKKEVITAGMDEFMAKPCTRVKLAAAIERIELVGQRQVYSEGSFRPFLTAR